MKLLTEFRTLKLKHPFTTSRKAPRVLTDSLYVYLEHEGYTGIGEIRPQEYYYNETFKVSGQVLKSALNIIGDDPFLIEDITSELKEKYYYAPATVAGIDIALHDLAAKILGVPLYKYLGVNPERIPLSSITVGLDEIHVMIRKLKELEGFPIIKLKAGLENDMEIIKTVRENTKAKIRVDANTGWEVNEAVDMINEMEKYDIEFIEQPIAKGNYEGLKKIKDNVNIPVITDEDSVDSKDIPNLVGCVDGINIKLMKCGGIREALKMVKAARTFGLQVMAGMMLESSVGTAAGANIAALTDYADLDANILISNDPFTGISNNFGKITLSELPGLGLKAI
ncbi:MAG: dipeptide epimerase [Victivallales bacterium]|nr:dipeptide epimerase [Victivallales bacterium]MCF7889039.1 dipeptide epimerase [Victivallales bacterium]